jgi:hypothetical protein
MVQSYISSTWVCCKEILTYILTNFSYSLKFSRCKIFWLLMCNKKINIINRILMCDVTKEVK